MNGILTWPTSVAALSAVCLACGQDATSVPMVPLVSEPGLAPAAIATSVDQASADLGGRALLAYSQRGDEPDWTHFAGYRNGTDGDPAGWDDAFELGSATKLFTAASILLLAEDGMLSLDDPLTTYFATDLLDDLTGGNGAALRVRHLMTHTSGIGDYINIATDPEVLTYYGTDGEQTYEPAELVELTRSYTIHQEAYPQFYFVHPAFTLQTEAVESYDDVTRSSYSNTGYVMLGMIVEQASGLSYERFVRSNILEPLGMSHTGMGTEGRRSDWAGRATDVTEGIVRMAPSFAWSAGAMVSTSRDMALFLRGAIGGELFDDPATALAWRTEHYLPLQGVYPYGRGLMRFDTYFGHLGQTFGGKVACIYDPDKDHVVVVAVGDSQVGDELGLAMLVGGTED